MKPRFIPFSNKRIEEMEERGLIELTEDHTAFFATTGNIYFRLQSRAGSDLTLQVRVYLRR